MTTKTERQQILGIPAKPHITTTTITLNRRLHKVITTHMGMVTAVFNIQSPREDGLLRFHQKRDCVLGFRDMRVRSSVVLHTRTLAFSMTNNNNMPTTHSSNLILYLGTMGWMHDYGGRIGIAWLGKVLVIMGLLVLTLSFFLHFFNVWAGSH